MVKTNTLFSEQFSLYKELYEQTNGKIDLEDNKSRKDLLSFVLSKRKEIQKILQKSESFLKDENVKLNKVNWYDFLSSQREILGLPKKIPYRVFNIYIQLIETHEESIDFDRFLKMFQDKDVFKQSGKISDNMENLMNNGGGSEFHAISEVISNAIDTTFPQNVVGRFGKGFFQIGRILSESGTKVKVISKKEGRKSYELILSKEEGELFVSSKVGKREGIGTTVEVSKKYSKKEQLELFEYIKEKYKTNKNVKLLVNGIHINDLGEYVYVNGVNIELPTKEVIIEIDDNGVKVIDYGEGMSSEDLSKKLLFPNDTTKARKEPKEEDLDEIVGKEVKFFYKKGDLKIINKSGEKKQEKTTISLMVGGVIIESFLTETSNGITDFALEFPSFTYLMENKSDISLTKEVIISLKIILEKIKTKVSDKKEKLAILEILGKIVEKLKERPTETSNSSKYNINKVLKKGFKSLKEDLESDGSKILSLKLKKALGEREGIYYVSDDLEEINLLNIPGVKKLKNIKNGNLPFYTIEFQKDSEISYIITKKGILVDSKYLNNEKTRDILNVLVNLNIGYELESEKVFYGVIENEEILKEGDIEKISINNNDLEQNINKLASTLSIEYPFLAKDIKTKAIFLKKNFTLISNSNDFYDLDGQLNYKIKLYLLSSFDLEEINEIDSSLTFKYLEIFSDLSTKHKKVLFEFIEAIKYTKEKWKYFEEILNLLGSESFREKIIKLMRNSVKDIGFINSMENLISLESQENINPYDLYKKDFRIFIGFVEKDIGEKVDSIYAFDGKNGIAIGIIKIDGVQYFYKWEPGKKIEVLKNLGEVIWENKIFPIDGGFFIEIEQEGLYDPYIFNSEGLTPILSNLSYKSLKNTSFGVSWLGSNEDNYFLNILDKNGKLDSISFESEGEISMSSIEEDKDWLHFEGLDKNGNKIIYVYELGSIRKIMIPKSESIENASFLTKVEDGIIFYSKDSKNLNIFILKSSGEIEKIFSIVDRVGIRSTKNGFILDDFDEKKYYILKNGKIVLVEIVGDIMADTNGNFGILSLVIDGGKLFLCIINDSEGVINKIELNYNHNIDWNEFSNGKIYDLSKETSYGFVFAFGNTLYKYDSSKNEISILLNFYGTGIEIDEIEENQDGNENRISLLLNINGISHNATYYEGQNILINGKSNSYSSIQDARKKIGIGAVNFIEFLQNGGEFLNEGVLEKGFKNLSGKFNLSHLIYSNNLETEEFLESILNNSLSDFFAKIQKKPLKLKMYQRKILSQIDGQDKSSQLWIRELVQNSVDAIRKTNDLSQEISVNFFENNGDFVATIEDSVGMSLDEVFRYLLPIGETGKGDSQSVGKFGQGFYSSFIGAKEVRVKTGTGNGKTIYMQIKPIYNKDGLINDFEILWEEKDENYKGTKIERIDNSTGIDSNLNAMFGIDNLEKYVSCVEGVKINYNSKEITGNNIFLRSENIGNIGNLRLLKNGNHERIVKDGLYMSYIKDKYLKVFPDRIIEIIESENLTIELPSKIDLVSSRNDISKEKDFEILKPYIFNLVTKYILELVLDGKVKIPMLPEDYFLLDYYEESIKDFKEIIALVNMVNNSGFIEDFELLKDKKNMALFLLLLEIERHGEKVSLQLLKKRRKDEEYLKKMTSGTMKIDIKESEERNRNMEYSYRGILSTFEVSQKLGIEEIDVREFLDFLNIEFSKLTQEIFGVSIKNNIYEREGGESRVADYGFDNNGIYMNWNIKFIERWILGYKTDKKILRDIIETITHELTHLKEGDNKWGTHEKDLEHDYSFEKIQREILEIYLKINC